MYVLPLNKRKTNCKVHSMDLNIKVFEHPFHIALIHLWGSGLHIMLMLVIETGYPVGDWLCTLIPYQTHETNCKSAWNCNSFLHCLWSHAENRHCSTYLISLIHPSVSHYPPKGSLCLKSQHSNWTFCLVARPPYRIYICSSHFFTCHSQCPQAELQIVILLCFWGKWGETETPPEICLSTSGL